MINVREKSNWLNKDIEYIRNTMITEYDLADGGLSVIKEFKLLEPSTIESLSKLPKEIKNITIGKIQAKNKELSKSMVEGFGEARTRFVTNNLLRDADILTIKKDAMFIINPRQITGKVGEFLNFRSKNSYSSYINLNNKEIYFSSITKTVEVKGLTEECYNKQKDYLLKDISRFLNQAERLRRYDLFLNLKKYQKDYLERKLDINVYRNMDTGLFTFETYDTEEAENVDDIDISYNYTHYVFPMIKILMNKSLK